MYIEDKSIKNKNTYNLDVFFIIHIHTYIYLHWNLHVTMYNVYIYIYLHTHAVIFFLKEPLRKQRFSPRHSVGGEMVAGAVGQGVHLDPGAAQEGSSLRTAPHGSNKGRFKAMERLVKYGKMGDSLGEH